MYWNFESAYGLFKDGTRSKMLTGGLRGLEKESQRIDPSGGLALTPHPAVFGDKLENKHITTDFSESQLELITPPFENASEVSAFLEKLQKKAEKGIGNELLWPLSMPPRLPDEELIPVARFADTDEGREKEAYRKGLALRYGKKMQMISGIHYNFSFDQDLLDYMHGVFMQGGDRRDFHDSTYFAVIRNYLRYRWLLVYLFGASPSADATYDPVVSREMSAVAKCCPECCDCARDYERFSTSLRVSRFGYSNDKKRLSGIRFNSLSEYSGGIRKLLSENILQKESEFYSPIRPKQNAGKGETQTDALEERGVKYLEVRILDLDPFEKTGISLDELRFLQVFMMFCLFEESREISRQEYEKINKNHNISALYGRKPGVMLYRYGLGRSGIKEWGEEIFEKLRLIADLIDNGAKSGDFMRSIENEYAKLEDLSLLPSSRIIREMAERGESFLEFGLRRASANRDLGLREASEMDNIDLEGLELSTQLLIREASARKVNVEILDRADNFIRLEKDGRTEYVKQATRTSADTYIAPLIMENKEVTKLVLREKGINVPYGITAGNMEEVSSFFQAFNFKGRDVVIKPKSTNFGKGVVILKNMESAAEYESAAAYAFKYDNYIMVEEFIPGREFRFLVIGGETAAVLHRVPANVKGDGVRNIKELVDEKNTDPLRGKGYKTPLEKISLGEVEREYLRAFGKDINYVPQKGETVYLRENSNISTGGDSVDYTDEVHDGYKKIAAEAARAAGAKICGADMIIGDIAASPDQSNYSIIELNFNPALHIHDYPYKGINRHVERKVLDLLGYGM